MILNAAKLSQSFRIARVEALRLLPLLIVFDFATMFAVLFLMPGGESNPSPAPDDARRLLLGGFVLLVVLPGFTLARWWLFRARSLGLHVDLALFREGISRGFVPLLGVGWAIFWRVFVVFMLAGMGAFLTSKADGEVGTAGWVMLVFLLSIPFVFAYLLPFVFVAYDRAFHPGTPFTTSLRELRALMAGRRLEIFVTVLIASLPVALANALLRSAYDTLSGLLFTVPIATTASLPLGLLLYLYYEEFELLAGRHPAPAAPAGPA